MTKQIDALVGLIHQELHFPMPTIEQEFKRIMKEDPAPPLSPNLEAYQEACYHHEEMVWSKLAGYFEVVRRTQEPGR